MPFLWPNHGVEVLKECYEKENMRVNCIFTHTYTHALVKLAVNTATAAAEKKLIIVLFSLISQVALLTDNNNNDDSLK